ncbi:uncharacterized protein LOC106879981 isoform X2 [Octopus bimaculoides]|nr:uncharacterized protein LOC106879981 isoform X2 [Octopus bimaculoides]
MCHKVMEVSLLYLKFLIIIQCVCVSLEVEVIDGGLKFAKKNQPTTLECFLAMQNFEYWQIEFQKIRDPWPPIKSEVFEANVISGTVNILNITLFSNNDVALFCKTTGKMIKFQIKPIYNDIGNLYPSSETPIAIKDKKFTLKCNSADESTSTIWYTENGTVIAKYTGAVNQNYSKYFGSRQEAGCQNKSCILSITNVSLAEDNMSIICSSSIHTSMFSITVFVLPRSITIKTISNTVPMENQNKSYECLIENAKPEFSVFWLITKRNGTQENATTYISNSSSKSGKLITLSSKLTLTLKRKFKELQCIVYFLSKSEFTYPSKKLEIHMKYSPERDDMTLNVSGGKVCVGTPTKFQCSLKGGDPPVSVTLMYKNVSNTSKEEVEITVTPESHRTVKCLGTHIAANVSREKNLTIYYPPNTIQIEADEPFLEGHKCILHCKAINGYPEKYSYRWEPNNNTLQDLTFPNISRTQNNKVFTCYASNMCNKKRELHKTHWINVEYVPDITASENMTLIENQASILNCSAEGNPIPEVRLEYENQSFPSNSPLTFDRRNSSDVFCVAVAKSTKHGNLTSRKKINILLKYPPQVNIHISNETNNTLLINCTAFDGNPANYEYKLKQKWGNATKNTYNISVLSINNSTFNNTGTWECHVSNEDFHVSKSSDYKITVKPIFSSISNNSKKRNVAIGESVIFKQCFYSHPKSYVKWQINDELIDFNKYLTTDFVSSDFPFKGICTSLKIEDIKDNDISTYTLTLENYVGKEVITFALKHQEITEDSLGTIIGCVIGIVLLIILVLLIRAVMYNKVTSSAKGVVDNYETISDELYNAESAGATISSKPKSKREQHAEDSEPRYLFLKHPDIDDVYVNVSRKPDDNREQDAEDSEPRYLPMKHPDIDDVYDSVSREPEDMDGVYVNVSKNSGEEQHAEVNEPEYFCVEDLDMDDAHFNISRKPDDLDDVYVNVSKKPDATMFYTSTH